MVSVRHLSIESVSNYSALLTGDAGEKNQANNLFFPSLHRLFEICLLTERKASRDIKAVLT